MPHLAVIGAFLLAQALVISNTSIDPGWDESVYIGMGKYIYSNGHAGLWETLRPPLLPLVAGFFWRVGLDACLWTRLFALVAAAGTLALSGALAGRFAGAVLSSRGSAWVGALVAALLASTPLFFWSSHRAMTEIPSAFFMLLAIWLMMDERWLCAGLAAAGSALTRFPSAILVAGALGGVIVAWARSRRLPVAQGTKRQDPRRAGMRFTLGAILALAPFFITNAIVYGPASGGPWRGALRPIILGSAHQSSPFLALPPGPWLWLRTLEYYPALIAHESPAIVLGIALASLAGVASVVRSVEGRARKRRGTRPAPARESPRSATTTAGDATTLGFVVGGFTVLLTLVFGLLYLTWISSKQGRFVLPVLPLAAITTGVMCIAPAWGTLAPLVTARRVAREPDLPLREARARRIRRVTLVGFAVASVGFGAAQIAKDTRALPRTSTAEHDRYESLAAALAASTMNRAGPVLTADPVIACYTDRALVPFYEAIVPGTVFINDWDSWAELPGAALVVYTPSSFPCRPGLDWCAGRERDLRAKILGAGRVVATIQEPGPRARTWYLVQPPG